MIKLNEKTGTLTFTGEDQKLVEKYAKEHKLTVRDVVYLAIMNGIAGGYFEAAKEAKKVLGTTQISSSSGQEDVAMVPGKTRRTRKG